jgi:hypothetical protein
MADRSKLILSHGEMELVTNTDWILTKRVIIDKVNVMFGALAESMRLIIFAAQETLPPAVILSAPKIAKGENYEQLPYVLLDYPRFFEKENIFAVRTMFWWGNFFSCTLHLSGQYKQQFEQVLLRNLHALKKNDFYICINENEWEHHFETVNYKATTGLDAQEIKSIMNQQQFIKLAAKFSLHQCNEMDVLLENCFSAIIQLLKY